MVAPGEWIILRRELRGTFTRRRWLAVIILWLVASAAIVTARWPEGTLAPEVYAGEARDLLAEQCLLMLAALACVLPAISVTAITREHEMDTYDQLRLSLIRDSALVRGKAFASMVMAVLFAVAVLPMFGISQFLLGLDNEHIYVIAIYILLFALMVVSVSSAAAFAFGRLVPALLVSYGICGMLLLSPLWFGAEAYNYGSGLVFLPRDEFSLLERFPVIGSWMLSFLFPSTALLTIVLDLVHYELFAVQCTILAGLSLLAYGIAIKSLRRRDRFESSVQSREVTDEQSLHARRASFPYYLVDPLRPKPSISDHQNPVLVREFRCALFYKLSTMIRVACVTFVFALFAIAAASLRNSLQPVINCLLFEIAALALVVPAVLAGSLGAERRAGNIDMIRMTLLPPRALLVGKLAGGLGAMAPITVAVAVAMLPAFVVYSYSHFVLAAGIITFATCMFVAASLSMLVASVAHRAETAVISSTLLIVAAFYLVPFAGWAYDYLRPGEYADLWEYWHNPPIHHMLSPVMSYTSYVSNNALSTNDYDIPVMAHWWLLSQIMFVAGSILALWLASFSFNRYGMRDT